MESSLSSLRWRWVAVGVFIISSVLNFLDRNLLGVLAPLIMAELNFNRTRLGLVISAFSLTYALAALVSGWALDRFGVNRVTSAAVGWWSAAAIGSGLISNLPGLALTRSALGIGESTGVAAVGKLNGLYLKPEERALGAAANQIGIAVAGILAPLAIAPALTYGWRYPFLACGAIGFLWIPLWLIVNGRIPPRFGDQEFAGSDTSRTSGVLTVLRSRNLVLLIVANLLWMCGYSLWSSWTAIYLKDVYGLTLSQTGVYLWVPPSVSILGGFFGGWISWHLMKTGIPSVAARRRAVWLSAVCSLATLLLLIAPNATWATALISLSFFFALAGSVNIYTLPIDIFGPQRSGIALGALTFAFGILQTGISPLIGWLADHHLYHAVIWLVTTPLLLSALVLNQIRSEA